MKRILTVILSLVMVLSSVPASFAAGVEQTDAVQSLYKMGLFQGTGVNPDGSPNFDLDRTPTRAEAVTMLVRLLGKDEEAKTATWDIPFTDVADWAKPYVGYAYAHGLTTGTSDETFGGDAIIDASQYLTFVLRALGYKSGNDFQWDKAWELSDKIGLTSGEYTDSAMPFLRNDVAQISYNALSQAYKGRNICLIQNLKICGAVKACDALQELLSLHGGLEYYAEYPSLPRWENIDPLAIIKLPPKHEVEDDEIYPYYCYEYTYYDGNNALNAAIIYRELLRNNGFSIKTDSSESEDVYFTATSLATGKSFDFSCYDFIKGQEWVVRFRLPKTDVIITENSYNSDFVISDVSLALEEGQSTIFTATLTPYSPTAKISWEAGVDFDDSINIEDLGTSIDGNKLVASARLTALKSGTGLLIINLENGSDYDAEFCFIEISKAEGKTDSDNILPVENLPTGVEKIVNYLIANGTYFSDANGSGYEVVLEDIFRQGWTTSTSIVYRNDVNKLLFRYIDDDFSLFAAYDYDIAKRGADSKIMVSFDDLGVSCYADIDISTLSRDKVINFNRISPQSAKLEEYFKASDDFAHIAFDSFNLFLILEVDTALNEIGFSSFINPNFQK